MFEPDSVWEFDTADRVKFGLAAAEELPDETARRGGSSVLFLTDEGVRETGLISQLIGQFNEDIDIEVYDGVEPDPAIDVFEDAATYARQIDPDILVGVGGGSSIDVAKTTSILAEHGGDVMDYVSPPTGEGKTVPGPGIPSIVLPTTAGTGSEMTPVSVISLPDRDLKVGISTEHQFVDLAIVDPRLTVSLPPGPTATTGIDALSHAIEAYVTRRFDAKERPESPANRPDYNGRSILTDQLARRAIDLIANNLQQAVNNGENLEARRNMSLASMLAGMAFANAGLGATHALAMAVGAEYHTPHGATIAACLPAVMRYNVPGASERYREIARLMGAKVSDVGRREAAERAADAVEDLVTDVGLDGGLSALGVNESEIPVLAEKTSKLERLVAGNPRRLDTGDFDDLLHRSL